MLPTWSASNGSVQRSWTSFTIAELSSVEDSCRITDISSTSSDMKRSMQYARGSRTETGAARPLPSIRIERVGGWSRAQRTCAYRKAKPGGW